MLGGMLAYVRILSPFIRAIVVGSLFFLAACSKESAVSFPLMLAVFDLALLPQNRNEGIHHAIHAFVKRNWQPYAAMLLAGFAYLFLRHHALGQLVNPIAVRSFSVFAQLQEACFIYLHYWKMLLWPMSGMSPLHEIDTQQFHVISTSALFVDAIAIGSIAVGLYTALRRSSPIGCIVIMMTVALLPVLHVAPVAFAPSLYHEHYAMTALAAICMMLPLIRIHAPTQQRQAVLTRAGIGIIGCFWLILAIINIRITLPLWSNNASLWQWALIENPDSINAKDNLLSAYIDENDFASANRLVGQLFADHVACTNCALNAAILAVAESDPTKAAEALEKVKNSTEVLQDKQMYRTYLVTTGQMLVQQGHLEDATGIFRAAIEMDPLDPQPQLSLATTLALQNKKDEARKIGDAAITLLPSDRRHAAYKILDQAIAIGSGIPPIGRAGDK